MGVDNCSRVCLELPGGNGEYTWPHQVCASEQKGFHVLLNEHFDAVRSHFWVLSCEQRLLKEHVYGGFERHIARQFVAVLAEKERVCTSGVVGEPGAHYFVNSQLAAALIKVVVVKNIVGKCWPVVLLLNQLFSHLFLVLVGHTVLI